MKRCNRCKQEQPLENFAKNKSRKDGLQGNCRRCQKKYNQEHYPKTKERWKDARAKSRAVNIEKNRQWLFNYLFEHPCLDCGCSDVRVLDFDHVRNKEFSVARLAVSSGLEKLKKEVEKCEVRCKNCHAIVTYERLGGSWRSKFTYLLSDA